MSKANARRTALLHVVPHIYPDVVGGIELCAHELAIALAGKFDVTVVSAWTSEKAPTDTVPYRLVAFRTRHSLHGNPISGAMTWWIAKHVHEFDIVHLHSHLFPVSAFAAVQSRVGSRPTLLTNHGLISHSYPVGAQRIWTRLALRTAFRGCSRLICFTEADAREYVKLGARREQIVIAPYGIDADRFALVGRRTAGPLRLLWIGRMAPEKGLKLLLQALASSQDLKGQVFLTLIGDGPQRAELQKLAKSLGLNANVTFSGPVTHDSVPALLSEHDALVLPSLAEGLPRIVLEAMATGLPVLCSSLPQLTESFGDSAVYFDPRNPDSVAAAILTASRDRASLALLGLAGRRLVEQRYSLDVAVGRLERVYEQELRNAGH